MDKERFKGLCLEILLLINGIMEAVKRNGYETMASLTMQGDDFFSSVFMILAGVWRKLTTDL